MVKSNNNKLCYASIHIRAHKIDPKPKNGICELCGNIVSKTGKTKLDHSNKDHSYKLPINPDEWWWIHRSCHIIYDIEHGIGRKLIEIQKIIIFVIKRKLTISINIKIIESLDEIRKSSNITRSKLIRDIITYFCNDEDLIDKVIKKNEQKISSNT